MTDDQELLMYVQGLINMRVKVAKVPDYMFKYASKPVQDQAIKLIMINGIQFDEDSRRFVSQ